MSRNLRSDVRRRWRRLEEQGEVELDVQDGRERLDELLTEGFAVEAASWKGREGTAIASQAETDVFYRQVARWAAERGWLRLVFLRLDGRALGFQLALEDERSHSMLKIGYDESFEKVAPGKLLQYALIRRAFELGLERYEFLGDLTGWKEVWAPTFTPLTHIDVYSRSPLGQAGWIAQVVGRPVAKRALALARRS